MVAKLFCLGVSMLLADVPENLSFVKAVKAAHGTYAYVVMRIVNNCSCVIVVNCFFRSKGILDIFLLAVIIEGIGFFASRIIVIDSIHCAVFSEVQCLTRIHFLLLIKCMLPFSSSFNFITE